MTWRARLCAALVVLAGAGVAGAQPDAAADDLVSHARALLAANRLPEAREPLERWLAERPDDVEAALLLARVYHGLGRRDQAIKLLEPVTEAHPNDARVLGLYGGQCLLRAGELGVSLRALRLARRGADMMERAVALAPDDVSYREGLVDFYRQAPAVAGGGLDKARRHASELARIDPVRGAAWLSSIYVQEGRHGDALAACDGALAVRPDDYAALFNFGRVAAESGLRIDEGEAALRRCLERTPGPSEPSHAGVWYRLGMIAERRANVAAARAAYAEALRLEPAFNRPAEALRRLAGDRG